jgi:hypothetical protein
MGGEHALRARRTIAVVLIGVLAATACSSSGGSGASPSGSAGEPATSAPPATAPPATRPPLEVPATYKGYQSEIYADPAHWVCRPDKVDPCDPGLDATVVEADGRLVPEPFKPAVDPKIDCFYVYPTISRDPTPNSDLIAGDTEEGLGAAAQVSRLAKHCRVFAPTYRQVTLTALRGAMAGTPMPGMDASIAIRDVVDAWKHYLANDNGGRGVVLVGHSQGAGLLTSLIKTEIDPNPDVRRFLVSAFIAGSSVRVPVGADVGGDFANIALCRRPDQTGCVLSWASFRAEPGPPANSRFGRVRGGAEGEAACVNPAALAGGKALLHSYFSRRPGGAVAAVGGAADAGDARWVDPAKGEITTNYVTTPGLVEGECVERDGASYLAVSVKADPADPRADDIGGDLTPDWGLHLLDIGLVMGDMVELVGRQVAAFTG